jgi:phosphatidate phosphatase APP1
MVEAIGNVVLPSPHAEFGIISDMDDTVLVSQATNLLKAVRLMMVQNARTRLPFAGVPAFYHALHKARRNPIFYVSSSPWNLYDMLTDFLALNGIPAGPLFLRDYGFGGDMFKASGHHGHKMTQIRHLLDFYPDLSFILIGDSGQHDPEIYREVVHEYPNRILGIYIRDVSEAERDAEVLAIVKEVAEMGVEMVFVADTVAAAEHAVGKGWIDGEEMPAILADKQTDESTPTEVERIIDEATNL